MLERFFRLSENQTTVRTEIIAGFTTFLTMAYIIVVQPAVLSGKNRKSGIGNIRNRLDQAKLPGKRS
jgi:xanthine/uracil/vitamin C permease (AzgA family)